MYRFRLLSFFFCILFCFVEQWRYFFHFGRKRRMCLLCLMPDGNSDNEKNIYFHFPLFFFISNCFFFSFGQVRIDFLHNFNFSQLVTFYCVCLCVCVCAFQSGYIYSSVYLSRKKICSYTACLFVPDILDLINIFFFHS